IAVALGLNRTGATRCIPALGLANIAIVALAMSVMRKDDSQASSFANICYRAVGIALMSFVVLELTNQTLRSFFTWQEVWFATGMAAAFTLFILQGRGILLGVTLVASHALVFGAVNPVERGLRVITNSEFYQFIRNHRELL